MVATGVRGCGTRVKGGIYVETGLTPWGQPIEYFLMDPPVEVPAGVVVPPQGVGLIQLGGTWHLIDRVGREFYPNVADFVEEVRRMGLSRRVQRGLDFAKLTKDSKILLVHDRAMVENAREYRSGPLRSALHRCPKNAIEHRTGEVAMCAGLWWEDVDGGVSLAMDPNSRRVTRTMPSFEYQAMARPDGVRPRYEPAVFLRLPIGGIAVVADGGLETAAVNAAARSPLGVQIVEA